MNRFESKGEIPCCIATVTLADIFGMKTLLEIASEYKITRWKHEVIDNYAGLIGKCMKKEVSHNPEVAESHRVNDKLKK